MATTYTVVVPESVLPQPRRVLYPKFHLAFAEAGWAIGAVLIITELLASLFLFRGLSYGVGFWTGAGYIVTGLVIYIGVRTNSRGLMTCSIVLDIVLALAVWPGCALTWLETAGKYTAESRYLIRLALVYILLLFTEVLCIVHVCLDIGRTDICCCCPSAASTAARPGRANKPTSEPPDAVRLATRHAQVRAQTPPPSAAKSPPETPPKSKRLCCFSRNRSAVIESPSPEPPEVPPTSTATPTPSAMGLAPWIPASSLIQQKPPQQPSSTVTPEPVEEPLIRSKVRPAQKCPPGKKGQLTTITEHESQAAREPARSERPGLFSKLQGRQISKRIESPADAIEPTSRKSSGQESQISEPSNVTTEEPPPPTGTAEPPVNKRLSLASAIFADSSQRNSGGASVVRPTAPGISNSTTAMLYTTRSVPW